MDNYNDLRKKITSDEKQNTKIKAIIDPLVLTSDQMQKVMTTLKTEMDYGLMSEKYFENKQTSLQMANTYVTELLDGSEDGDFLGLDLGGTNFRVLLCQMRNGKCTSKSCNYNLSKEKLYGPAEEVFDHLANSIYIFLKEENLLDKVLPLGFTFSFPMKQTCLKSGILLTWTKTFACTSGVGQDAAVMLEEALAKIKGLSVNVVAVLNDTTGTLLAGSYLDKQCAIGLIMGTGCNAAYIESTENVKYLKKCDEKKPQIVIDTEWGAFGDNGSLDFLKTPFDRVIDEHSNHTNSFTFEKLFAGHYIGDLARLVMVQLIKEELLFSSQIDNALKIFTQWQIFTANHLSDVERDATNDAPNTSKVLSSLSLSPSLISVDDVTIVRYVCSTLTRRACQLISSSVATLLCHISRDEVTIAIDGSLYKYHPHLHDLITCMTAELAPQTKSKYILAEDGSGRGAAFLAAVTTRTIKD